MKLYKQSLSNNWYYDIHYEGRRVRRSTKTSVKKDAVRIAAYNLKTIHGSSGALEVTYTLKDAVYRYLEEQSLKSHNTYKQCRSLTNTILKHFGQDVVFNKITSNDLLKFRDSHNHLTTTSRNHLTTCMVTMKNRCRDWGVIAPRFRIKKLKEKHKLRYLLDGEEELLINQCNSQDCKDMIIILVDTGMRYSELSNLTWSSIDKDNKTINVYRYKVDKEGLITTTNRVRSILSRRRQTEDVYVFSHRDNKNKPRPHSTKAIMRAADRAGLNSEHSVSRYGRFTVHSLRDTFATRLVKAGCSLYEVQIMLGHSSPQMTQKYAHLASKDVSDKVARILETVI